MRTYTITVNGNAYEVTVQEGAGGAPVYAPAPVAAATVVPAPVPAPAPAATVAPAPAGGVTIEAGAAGKVLKINAPAGTKVKKGDPVVTLESMKMEIPMVAPQDGTVASVNVSEGASCEAGDVLATMN